MTPYELQRQRNIEANNETLNKLGLTTAQQAPRAVKFVLREHALQTRVDVHVRRMRTRHAPRPHPQSAEGAQIL